MKITRFSAALGVALMLGLPSLNAAPAAIGQVGGFNIGVPFTPTVQNGSYASGNSLGGLQTVPFFRSKDYPSGIVDNFQLTSQGGSTVAMTVYIYDTLPTGTCTDKTAFVEAAADVGRRFMAPFVLTPAVVGAGATSTTAQLTQTVSGKNNDTNLSRNLYICIVAGGSVTPATASDLVGKISGALD